MAAVNESPRRIAIIGGGVAGLAAAWHLSQVGKQKEANLEVELWEAEDRLGGHAWTVPVVEEGEQTTLVDIGFMVYNALNYPNLMAWFRCLNVSSERSDMSLAVSLTKQSSSSKKKASSVIVEWSSSDYSWQRLFSTLYRFVCTIGPFNTIRLVTDMFRFNNTVTTDLLSLSIDDPRRFVSIEQYLRNRHYSPAFATYYLYPMMAALWSASLHDVCQFPAVQVVSFLQNHQMLQLLQRPVWQTVAQRSRTYVQQVEQELTANPHGAVHTGARVHSIREQERGRYQLVLEDNNLKGLETIEGRLFDHVVFACHTDQARCILERSTFQENRGGNDDLLDTLQDVEYADNAIYVHSDVSLMPRDPQAWASWNCIGSADKIAGTVNARGVSESLHLKSAGNDPFEELEGINGRFKAVYVTYWLNRLQNLTCKSNVFVSLNPHFIPDPARTYHRVIMAHPQFTQRTLLARLRLLDPQQYQGKKGMWFCGAWGGYGFHEDGCRSGFEVATQISGIPLPWSNVANDNQSSTPMVLPPPDLTPLSAARTNGLFSRLYRGLFYQLPVAVCKRFIYYFLKGSIQRGVLHLKYNDGTIHSFGDASKTSVGCDAAPVTLRIFDPWFFVKTALEYDLGLARSYMAGYFLVEPLDEPSLYHPVMQPLSSKSETTSVIGDPVGLTRLFLLFIGNRDLAPPKHVPIKSGRGHSYSGAFTNASGLLIGKIGSFFNYLRYKISMDNSERGGSLRNIHAHYDISNDLFRTFLDKETLMYSSAIYDAIPSTCGDGLLFRGTLEEAQWRKLDTLLARAQVQPGQTLLDIGFGWGGLSLHAAKKYGCRVTGITLSVEQKALAEERVKVAGLQSLITFEVVDYRTFARRKENFGMFDRVLSCEMIEAVGHRHLGEFFWAIEQVLAKDGILVMEAITTPEQRYETYIRSTDFINTIIFPGSCCPSLHALIDAAYRQSSLTLEHIDNIGLHYAQTLAEWRRRFNSNEADVRRLGFDDVFLRAWNYYLTYCEAGFFSQTENCLILVFSRQGCKSLVPLCETRSVTQPERLSSVEASSWLADGLV